MTTLTRQQIADAPDTRREPLEIPEWGGSVVVREMTSTERDKMETQIGLLETNEQKVKYWEGSRAKLAVRCVLASLEGNQPLFTDADIPMLEGKGASALSLIFNKILVLSRMTRKDVESLLGNSDAGKTGSSISV